jgi:hypothetical protein
MAEGRQAKNNCNRKMKATSAEILSRQLQGHSKSAEAKGQLVRHRSDVVTVKIRIKSRSRVKGCEDDVP